jgi:hypothetical protein
MKVNVYNPENEKQFKFIFTSLLYFMLASGSAQGKRYMLPK